MNDSNIFIRRIIFVILVLFTFAIIYSFKDAESATSSEVTQTIPQELQLKQVLSKEYNWEKTDTSFALLKGENVLWKYNFNGLHGKPYFHPIFLDKNNLTCIPSDHLHHVGQWFSWKYINKVNYWEYKKNTFRSEGVTEIQNIELTPNQDFSAEITMKIVYHPVKGENVLSEFRTIKISPPQKNGGIWMDYDFKFKAIADTVLLDRTPLEGEPGGNPRGGYVGLSIRFNQDLMGSYFISSWNGNENIRGKTGDWLYMGFTGLDGKQVGSQIMIAPNTQKDCAAWYAINDDDLPFYYLSPSFLYKKPLVLLKGDKLTLNYRVLHVNGETNKSALQNQFKQFKKEIN